MQIEAELERFIAKDLLVKDNKTRIDPDESLISSGVIDSLAILQLIAFVEERFDITIDDDEVTPDNFETISVIKELIEKKLQ